MDAAQLAEQINTLVDRHRSTCLWFLRADYYPSTEAERLDVLEAIQKHGDLEAYRQAGEFKKWLLQSSSAASAVS